MGEGGNQNPANLGPDFYEKSLFKLKKQFGVNSLVKQSFNNTKSLNIEIGSEKCTISLDIFWTQGSIANFGKFAHCFK